MSRYPLNGLLTLEDALHVGEALPFSLMLKPGGDACNLSCKYCYYLGKPRPAVADKLWLETAVREHVQKTPGQEVSFDWHGGEPLLLGLDFFREAVRLQKRYARGKTVRNTLQTNGTLLTREWARFFREEGFLVGISIDGPQDLHDAMRGDRRGAPTFGKVLRSVELLHQEGAAFNTLTAVSRLSEGRGREVYRLLRSIGSCYMQFLPVLEFGRDGVPTSWSVTAEGWGQLLCDIFDEWVRQDVGRYFVNLFDATLASWCGVERGLCVVGETCPPNAALERGGEVYPCDHFVADGWLLGRLGEAPLQALVASSKAMEFRLRKRNALPSACLQCKYIFACNGECPVHRSARDGKNALCAGYYHFFTHSEPYMLRMRQLLEEGRAPSDILSLRNCNE